ncbi:MAG: hypothetical protein NXH75_08025, partial [Halobacteriovoraceae bacterium]|nr:hypothetical protein [Halobacteriovoraceae bacterium]
NLRIHPNFACQLDCTISSLGSDGKVEINDKGVEGIRFQPIYLPQNKEMFNKDWRGNGLFERGLHYSGYSTPGNVTLCGICDDCKKSFHFKSINTGFSDHSYSYSESGLYTRLVARGESEEAVPKIAPDKTSFSPLNSFCCPHCGSDYISFENQDKKSIERYANIHSGLTPLTSS